MLVGLFAGAVRLVHVIPSGEVYISPLFLMTMKQLPTVDQQKRDGYLRLVDTVALVQVVPLSVYKTLFGTPFMYSEQIDSSLFGLAAK